MLSVFAIFLFAIIPKQTQAAVPTDIDSLTTEHFQDHSGFLLNDYVSYDQYEGDYFLVQSYFSNIDTSIEYYNYYTLEMNVIYYQQGTQQNCSHYQAYYDFNIDLAYRYDFQLIIDFTMNTNLPVFNCSLFTKRYQSDGRFIDSFYVFENISIFQEINNNDFTYCEYAPYDYAYRYFQECYFSLNTVTSTETFNYAYEQGKTDDYNKGLNESLNDLGVLEFVPNIVGSAFALFAQIGSFEVWGISINEIVFFFASVSLLVFMCKMFL